MSGGEQGNVLVIMSSHSEQGERRGTPEAGTPVRDAGTTRFYMMPKDNQNPVSSSSPGLQSRPK